MTIRSALRRELEESADRWVQTKLVGGLMLLAGIISLLLTSDLPPAGGSMLAWTRPPVSGGQSSQADQGDCGGSKDSAAGARATSIR